MHMRLDTRDMGTVTGMMPIFFNHKPYTRKLSVRPKAPLPKATAAPKKETPRPTETVGVERLGGLSRAARLG